MFEDKCKFLEERIKRLNEIGIALSTERDTNKLFELILEEAKNITNADGRTLYMVDEKGNLKFTLTPTKGTLGDVLKKYLQKITPRKKSSDREESRINNLIKDPIALVQFCNLRPQHIIAYRNHRLNNGVFLR